VGPIERKYDAMARGRETDAGGGRGSGVDNRQNGLLVMHYVQLAAVGAKG